LEYVDHERVQFDQREVLSLWEKALSEPTFLHNQNLGLADYSSLQSGRAATPLLNLSLTSP